MNVWRSLPQPFFALAPMDDVTDVVFRQIVDFHAPADIYFTEFANADGLQSPGRSAVEKKLLLEEGSKPVIAQIWGKDPEAYYKTAKELASRGFAGIDINMGCPVRAVIKNGCCSALIENRALAQELIVATKSGIADAKKAVAMSVKTRIGFSKIETEEWCGWLLEQGLDALTIHGRIATEMSKYPANWDEIAKASALRDTVSPDTVIVGNGDVLSTHQGKELAKATNIEGIMIGRGIFKNPWVFNEDDSAEHRPVESVELLVAHLRLWKHTWGDDKPFDVMKKFFKMYIAEWDGASKFRAELMDTQSLDEALTLLAQMHAELSAS